MPLSDRFWNASAADIKNGYLEEAQYYRCLFCDAAIEKGIVYPVENVFYEAGRYIRIHLAREHGSVFECLVNLDKRYTGLTDHQNSLLRLFYLGQNDAAIQRELGIGSPATIRNHRFMLREKERQAKVFLAIMALLKDRAQESAGRDPAGHCDGADTLSKGDQTAPAGKNGNETASRKKELKQLYKEIRPQAGVYQIKNTVNQKVLVEATSNLKTINGKRLQLWGGTHKNRRLQEEWRQFGEGAFIFEVLEVLEEKEAAAPGLDREEELQKLKAKWLAKLQPYDERGYHLRTQGEEKAHEDRSN